VKYSPTKWRIHIGAHKTATTHVQDLAEIKCDKLYSEGIDFISRLNIRKNKVLAKPGRFQWRYKFNGKPLFNAFNKRVNSLRKGAETVVLSEENFLGCASTLLSSSFYFPPSPHIQTLISLSKRDNVSIFLSIRPQVDIIPSAYIQVIRTQQLKNGFDAVRNEVISHPPSWLTLVRYLSKTIPNAHLSIWRMEDYLQDKSAVLSHLFGITFPPFEDIETPSGTKSPSAEAIDKIYLLPPNMLVKEYKKQVAEIIASDQGETKFSPFTEAERLILIEKYDADIIAIKEEFPGLLLEV